MKAILFSILFFSCLSLFGQTKQDSIPKWFTFSTNVMQDVINELNINVERGLNSRISIGANIARIYPNSVFSVVFLSPSQNYWPGSVYDGYSFRFYLKIYSKTHPYHYKIVQLIYKTESFTNVSFMDDVAGSDESYVVYTRTENTSVYGLDLLFGYEPNRQKMKFFSDVFYGFGFRSRDRNGTTLTVENNYGGQSLLNGPYLGPYHIDQFYPTIIFGMKFGFYFCRKNPPPSRPF